MSEKAKNGSFKIIVNKDAISPPLLETDIASSIEIRDSEGNLQILIVMVPGFPVLFKSAADKDKDFPSFCQNMGFKMKK